MRQRTPIEGREPVAVLLSPRPAVVAAARRAGARTVVVAPVPSVPSDREGAERRVRADWRDHRRLVGAVGPIEEVRDGRAAVFGFDAASALAAARANEELGLPGTPTAAVTALMDKAALRVRSNALHPARPVSFARCGRAATLPFVATLIGYPCVVKPRAGSDGEGVRLVRDEAEASAAALAYPEVTDLLVEEYLEGPELAVEALSRAGRHRVLGWSRRRPGPGLTAAGHELPVALNPGTAEAVRALVRGVLDLAGHGDGPSHTEVVLTRHGPRLIEAHARPGGEEFTRLLRLAHGTDILGLALASGLGLPDPERSPRAACAGLRYVDFPPGRRLDGVRPGIAAARAVPGVVRVQLEIPPGATVRRAPTGARHHAYVLATAATPGSLARVLDRATGLLGQAPPARRIPQPEGGLA
ncbi:ATP-grasp domain-containing protein [Streptomyces antarcticus]|uniref:ATP-grasp domain-containing protein n=1 Tax=Streptomyces antarcticus TaxID=2996458 RepID=UPI00226D6792|nr:MULTISPECIES: ATP-grasp domain-containing protein [unclassified Streptomyces]MCY0944058.1 ATP-grasp domain-containing protein [Streptomyces sp. H34-AA3]MCZ4082242.1 ATP-grasp domain-containing protein [Streptomyces sp. H34-S5]